MPPQLTCDGCVYWAKRIGGPKGWGECHRFPPIIVTSPQGLANPLGATHFPECGPSWWCGEGRETLPTPVQDPGLSKPAPEDPKPIRDDPKPIRGRHT